MKNFIVRVELIEERPPKKNSTAVIERRHDGFVIECDADRDEASDIFENIHHFCDEQGFEMMTVEAETEDEEQEA